MTDPRVSVSAAGAQLRSLRDELGDTLDRLGLAAAVAGTHPRAVWSETEVTSASRYRLIHRTMRASRRASRRSRSTCTSA
jgi:gamma-glutamyl:cysteine ligase YbdK (ATP-grasp superfamily)